MGRSKKKHLAIIEYQSHALRVKRIKFIGDEAVGDRTVLAITWRKAIIREMTSPFVFL